MFCKALETAEVLRDIKWEKNRSAIKLALRPKG